MIKKILSISTGLILGIVGASLFWMNKDYFESLGMNYNTMSMVTDRSESNSAEKPPLYWVAPMDANYRRDQPGKSPMGMDLVPFYSEEKSDSGVGTVTISAAVVNNIGVRIAPVEIRALNSTINTVGYVHYDEDKMFNIHPRVEGWVEKLHVKSSGEPVKKGQALYDLYSPQLVNAQQELLLSLNRNNPVLIAAAEDRLNALQLPKSLIKQIKRNRKIQQTVTFTAPYTGIVEQLNIREGDYIKPMTRLMSFASLETMWVEAEVFERQVAEVVKGQPVTMRLDYLPGKRWQGKVDYIYPTLNDKTRTTRVRMRFANLDKDLKPNMFAQVTIHPDKSTQFKTIVVPREAVIRTKDQNRVVLALGDGKFKSIAVDMGAADESYIEIFDGVDMGDQVVVSAQFLLDSESSKTSDFQRMESMENEDAMTMDIPASIWTEAQIKGVMSDKKIINVQHPAIDAWGWPQMQMDFEVDDSIDLSTLKVDMTLHIEIQAGENGRYKITAVHIPDNDSAGVMGEQDSMNKQEINHEASNPKTMDHSQHSTMETKKSGDIGHGNHGDAKESSQ